MSDIDPTHDQHQDDEPLKPRNLSELEQASGDERLAEANAAMRARQEAERLAALAVTTGLFEALAESQELQLDAHDVEALIDRLQPSWKRDLTQIQSIKEDMSGCAI